MEMMRPGSGGCMVRGSGESLSSARPARHTRAAMTSVGRQYLFDPHRLDLLNEVMAEDAVRDRAADSAAHCPTGTPPGVAERSIVQSDVPSPRSDDTPTLVRKDEEYVEDLKSDSRDR